nr:MAG TPA: DNA-directed RNA polymerase [Caudoviricetes sp.]
MKYYYKLINNETNEIESYVESSGCIRPENICHILGLSGYHAVSCTKQEYEEKPTAENTESTAEAILSELKDINTHLANMKGYEERDENVGEIVTLQDFDNQITEDVQEVKHGKWEYDSGDVGYANYLCSECKNFLTFYEDIDLYPYCPYCGAKMDKE